jgi:amino-acid N-acetyltransferase
MATIEAARETDLPAITALLERCALPSVDVAPHLAHFTVAREGSNVVGVIGLEVHGTVGLLRSLAVDAECRGGGLARRLYAAELGVAQRSGVERLYCLTTTAQGFFEMLGWRVLLRDEVPLVIQETHEFTSLCPASAICLVRAMPHD